MAGDTLDGVTRLVEREAAGTQRHALVDLHVAPDDTSLADDDTRAVVDGEIFADGGTGVNVDASPQNGPSRSSCAG
jgi:hypothetical protein